MTITGQSVDWKAIATQLADAIVTASHEVYTPCIRQKCAEALKAVNQAIQSEQEQSM